MSITFCETFSNNTHLTSEEKKIIFSVVDKEKAKLLVNIHPTNEHLFYI